MSYVKNYFDNCWYKYDDEERTEVKEELLEKESAYLLFYIRKDIVNKDVASILPNIEKSFFAGKPVQVNSETQNGGFIMEAVTSDQLLVKFKNE